MKIKIICLIFACLFSLDARAAIFGSDRLNYADNADAVNEIIEKEYTIHQDGSVDYRLYIRTRIITYRGKKVSGDMKVPYNSAYESVEVNMERTGTIRADGTRVSVSKEEINDIQDPSTSGASLFSAARLRVINFPAVEPGTAVETEIHVHTSMPGKKAFWKREYFALSAPTALKRVTIHVPAEIPLYHAASSRIIETSHSEQDGTVTWIWQGTRLPKAVDEPMSPPAVHISPVLFVSTLPCLKGVAEFYASLIPSEGIDSTVFHDTGKESALSATERADRLYIKFMSRFRPYRIDFFDTSLEPGTPDQTLNQGYGTPLQLACLFRALMKKKAIDASLYAVSDRCMISMLPLSSMPDLFGTFCIRVQDRWYSFEKRELSPGITGLEGRQAIDIASGKSATVHDASESLDITVLSMQSLYDSTTRGMLYSMTTGGRAARTRRGLRYLTEPELGIARSMILHTVNPVAEGTVQIFSLDSLMEPVGIRVDFSIPEPRPSMHDATFFPIPAPSMIESFAAISEDRKTPLWFPQYSREATEFSLKLPIGARVKSLPADFHGKAGPFSWMVSVRQQGRTIYYVRELEKERGMLKKGPEFERFMSALRMLAGPSQGVVIYNLN